jgi:hypothetical protein
MHCSEIHKMIRMIINKIEHNIKIQFTLYQLVMEDLQLL